MKAIMQKTNQTIKIFNYYMDRFEEKMLKISNILF
jgi:hypothetical protein